MLDVVDEGLVAEVSATGCRVAASEVPVARMVGAGVVESLDALED